MLTADFRRTFLAIPGERMSFFTEEEQESLTINRMILHVVGNKDFQAMPERALEEEGFFVAKIVDMAAAPVFMFKAFQQHVEKSRLSRVGTFPSSVAPKA